LIPPPGAILNLDRVMHKLGVSLMAIWFKTGEYCMRGHGIAASLSKTKAEEDKETIYSVVDVMMPFVASMYLIQGAVVLDYN
jgi:hypothetical protein